MDPNEIVAIGLLTKSNLEMLGTSLKHVIPVSDDDRFDDLVKALDGAQLANSES